MSSKAICFFLTVSTMLMGCFTQSVINKDEFPPDDRKVLFHLRDGSYIKVLSGNHHRIDDGYQISGELVSGGQILRKFEGVVHDSEIDMVTVERFNTVGTVALVGGVALLCVGLVEMSHMKFGGGL